MTWKMCATTVVILIVGAVVEARQPVEHTITVTVGARCSLDAAPGRLSANAGDTIVLRIAATIPNNGSSHELNEIHNTALPKSLIFPSGPD